MDAQRINVNLIPGGVLPRINVSQYDYGRPIEVSLYDGAAIYNVPSNAEVTVEGTKRDNTGFQYECTFSNNVVYFDLTNQMSVFQGEVFVEIVIRVDGDRAGTGNFIIWVEKAGLQDDVVISETDIPIIEQIPEKMQEAIAAKNEAVQSAIDASESALAAEASETNAKTSEDNALASENAAKTSEDNALASENAAKTSEDNALNYSDLSQSYAVGTNGVKRPGDATDNAEYYYEQAKNIAEGLQGGIIPQGTVAFASLPPLADVINGGMYNISDSFTTTDDFTVGAGVVEPAGSNIYKLVKNGVAKWDVFVGSTVLGVKGSKETYYRKGEVNITPENIGSPTIEQFGTTDISGIGDGTVTGGLSQLNAGLIDEIDKTSGATKTEIGYLSGVTSKVQTQLNGKQATLTDSGNITLNSQSGCVYRRYGKICSIRVNTAADLLKPNETRIIGTLPTGYRPYNQVYARGIFGVDVFLQIETNGQVKGINNVNANSLLATSISFICV